MNDLSAGVVEGGKKERKEGERNGRRKEGGREKGRDEERKGGRISKKLVLKLS